MTLRATLLLTEMSTMNLPWGKWLQVIKAGITVINAPTINKTSEPRRLTNFSKNLSAQRKVLTTSITHSNSSAFYFKRQKSPQCNLRIVYAVHALTFRLTLRGCLPECRRCVSPSEPRRDKDSLESKTTVQVG
jgi:hypothetical protein